MLSPSHSSEGVFFVTLDINYSYKIFFFPSETFSMIMVALYSRNMQLCQMCYTENLCIDGSILIVGDSIRIVGDSILIVGDSILIVGDSILIVGDSILIVGDSIFPTTELQVTLIVIQN